MPIYYLTISMNQEYEKGLAESSASYHKVPIKVSARAAASSEDWLGKDPFRGHMVVGSINFLWAVELRTSVS